MGLSVLFPLRHKMTKVPGPPCHIRYQTTKRLMKKMRDLFFSMYILEVVGHLCYAIGMISPFLGSSRLLIQSPSYTGLKIGQFLKSLVPTNKSS